MKQEQIGPIGFDWDRIQLDLLESYLILSNPLTTSTCLRNKPLIYIYEQALRGFDSPEHAQSQ